MQVEGRDDLAHIAIFDHPDNAGYPQAWRVDDQLGVGPARSRTADWTIARKARPKSSAIGSSSTPARLNDVEMTDAVDGVHRQPLDLRPRCGASRSAKGARRRC